MMTENFEPLPSIPEDEVRRVISESGSAVAAAVLRIHAPQRPPQGQRWIDGGGTEARCAHSGDPFDMPEWPCETIDAVISAITAESDRLTPEIFTWDWNEQPPMEEVFSAAGRLSSRGRIVVMRMIDTGADQYACVVADHAVTDEEAASVMDAQTITAEELRRMT